MKLNKMDIYYAYWIIFVELKSYCLSRISWKALFEDLKQS